MAFELLQEAGLHLPQNLGQAVSIIGGLVVGSAAVDASLISPAALIVVAAAGICGFTLPQRDFADAIRIWRLAMVGGALVAGMAGVALVVLALLLHLGDLSSLGVSYLWPIGTGEMPHMETQLVREKMRPREVSPGKCQESEVIYEEVDRGCRDPAGVGSATIWRRGCGKPVCGRYIGLGNKGWPGDSDRRNGRGERRNGKRRTGRNGIAHAGYLIPAPDQKNYLLR